jgi:hypothetical protein
VFAWFKDLGPSKDSAYILSAVANLTSALLDVPLRRALALSQLCSSLATPWVSGELDFPQHRNLIWASTLHCSTKTRELLYSRLLLQLTVPDLISEGTLLDGSSKFLEACNKVWKRQMLSHSNGGGGVHAESGVAAAARRARSTQKYRGRAIARLTLKKAQCNLNRTNCKWSY